MSDLLRLLMTKEQREKISQNRANHSRRSLLSCSFLNSNRAQIAQVALNKRATINDLLLLLFTKGQLWAIRSGC